MANNTNVQPQLSPYDPAHDAIKQQEANEQALDAINALSAKVDSFVYAPSALKKPAINPYLAWGGAKKQEYNVCYKNVSYLIKAKSLLEAVQEAYLRMLKDIPNLNMKNKLKISVQRKSNKRFNHIYHFLVKKEKIKNPNYKSKITITKL